MKHLGGYFHVGGDKGEHSGHVGIYHTAALAHSAKTANLIAQLKLNSKLLLTCIGGHYSGAGVIITVFGKHFL